MANYRVMVRLATVSGIPEDSPVNVFHFTSTDIANDDLEIRDALVDFYDDLNTRFGNQIAQNGHSIKMYDLADPTPRAPIAEYSWNMTAAPTGDPLPTEIALCLSFQGNRVSGTSQARRRGRVYIGPWAEGQQDTANNGRPSAGTITALVTSGDDLLTASQAASTWRWCVWSPTDAAMVQVTNGWVDNAWDVQRRRGVEPTTRETFAT